MLFSMLLKIRCKHHIHMGVSRVVTYNASDVQGNTTTEDPA